MHTILGDNMKRTLLSGLLLLSALVGVGSAAAQSELPETPLVALVDNNLYGWTPGESALTQLTSTNYGLLPSVSPDATEIAYGVYAPITIDAVARTGGIGGGSMPSDIWLLNSSTGETRPIAVQPENASFFTEGVDDYAISRSQPMWSWDGMMLAWAEHVYPLQQNDVMVHDFATGTSRVLYDAFPEQAMVSGPMSLTWVGPFVVVRSIGADASNNFTDTFFVIGADGSLVQTIPMPEEINIQRFEMVQQNGRAYLGVMGNDASWTLYDPVSGVQEPLQGYVETFAWLAAETSLALEPRQDESGNPIWQAHDSLGRPVERYATARYYPTERITLSPDGQTVAFAFYDADARVFEDTVRVQSGSTGGNMPDAVEDPFVWAFVWGPMSWRSRIRSTPAQPNVDVMAIYEPQTPLPVVTDVTGIVCPGAPTPRLLPGDTARVLGTTANNVRSQPSVTSGQVIGQIPAGAEFSVLEGPACQDGLTWYRVQYGTLEGWTAEGQGRDYWVEPLG
jgi:hypothetical protein